MGSAMTAGSIMLGVAVLLLVALFVLRPLLSPTGHRHGSVSRRESLRLQKEAILAHVRGLELEYETGKLPEAEFIQDRQQLVQQAADILRELERLERDGDDLDGRIEAAIAQVRAPAALPRMTAAGAQPVAVDGAPAAADDAPAAAFCPHCGAPTRAGDRFCRQCGTALT